jgi:EAL domain-containing protein (putative c-di-GMP-specific phosphodiesterase class I)
MWQATIKDQRSAARDAATDARSFRGRPGKRLRTENELRRGIEIGDLCLHFQPVVSVEDGRIRSLEALVRWNHPQRGVLLPEEFIPVAEETGLIVPLGSWVIEEACRQAASWRPVNPGHDVPRILVNLSARQLARPDFEDTVLRALRETGLEPSALTLEITETVLMDASPATLGLLSRLREAGVHLAIDDFGTGYSSLNYLKRFPVDALKVDRSFVNGLGRDPEDSAIVAAVVSLAHALGLSAVAEGVETTDQLRQLAASTATWPKATTSRPRNPRRTWRACSGSRLPSPAPSDMALRRRGPRSPHTGRLFA